MQHINQYNVIYIDFSRISSNDYQSYIDNIAEVLKNDLHKAYPDVDYRAAGGVAEDLERITAATGERFIFIFDEWDAIFHAAFISEDDRKKYLLFLKDLLKDRVYVQLAYMTGVLPISKYTSGSELNTFAEYNMATMSLYSDVFGFNDTEVDALFAKYQALTAQPQVTREGLKYGMTAITLLPAIYCIIRVLWLWLCRITSFIIIGPALVPMMNCFTISVTM